MWLLLMLLRVSCFLLACSPLGTGRSFSLPSIVGGKSRQRKPSSRRLSKELPSLLPPRRWGWWRTATSAKRLAAVHPTGLAAYVSDKPNAATGTESRRASIRSTTVVLRRSGRNSRSLRTLRRATGIRAGGNGLGTDDPSTTLTHDHPGPVVEYSRDWEEGEKGYDQDSPIMATDNSRRLPSVDRRRRRRRVMVLMDCFTPYLGLYVASKIKSEYRDVAVVHVLSDYLRIYSEITQPENREQWEAARIPTAAQLHAWKGRVFDDTARHTSSNDEEENAEWVGVYSESDSGLEDAERLRLMLNVTGRDDPTVLEDRRHKYLMSERIRASVLATVRQKLCESKEEAREFAETLLLERNSSKIVGDSSDPSLTKKGRIVVKPFRGCGTESVRLCETLDQVEEAWETIMRTKVFATQELHRNVLVQEFLEGTEYAVDVVARNGVYKVAAIWRYDKRPANGAPFCYFRTQLVDHLLDANVPAVVEYVQSSLRALGVKWGISHTEVIVVASPPPSRGPILVEVNCRQHNMDFAPITMCCVGYNALDMMVEAYLGVSPDREGENDDSIDRADVAPPLSWEDKYPDIPTLRAHGSMVHLVNYASGELAGPPNYMEEIAGLPSVLDMEVYDGFLAPGSVIEPTVDIKTDAGWVQLVSDDTDELERDYSKILEWMPTMFEVAEPQ